VIEPSHGGLLSCKTEILVCLDSKALFGRVISPDET